MQLPAGESPFEWVEVRFKNGRKDFYKNTENLSLHAGEAVTVSTPNGGHDVGTVSVTGELVRIQMRKAQADTEAEAPLVIYRKSSQRDLDRWKEARDREDELMRGHAAWQTTTNKHEDQRRGMPATDARNVTTRPMRVWTLGAHPRCRQRLARVEMRQSVRRGRRLGGVAAVGANSAVAPG